MTRAWCALLALIWCVLASGCAPLVHISTQLEGPAPPPSTVGLAAAFRVGVDSIAAALENAGGQPVEVLWRQTLLVDVDGQRWSVAHGPDRGGSSDDDLSTIPTGGTLRTTIRPRQVVGVASGARVPPFSPVRCGPVECAGYEELVGRTIQLDLAVRSGGEVHTYTWRFRITRAVMSTRGGRPTDPDLVPRVAPTQRSLDASAYRSGN